MREVDDKDNPAGSRPPLPYKASRTSCRFRALRIYLSVQHGGLLLESLLHKFEKDQLSFCPVHFLDPVSLDFRAIFVSYIW
jgi:hypothetical protein